MSGGNGESPPVNVGVRQQDQTIMIYNSRVVCDLLKSCRYNLHDTSDQRSPPVIQNQRSILFFLSFGHH